jgi:predicted nucleic acid-binding Zn ribbon protein
VNAGQGSKSKPDFARLGDLLGDACEGPAEAPVRTDNTSGTTTARPPTRARPASPARKRATPGVHDPARLLALIWPDIVGAEVAANARPVQLKGGRLTVSASSAAWAQTLQFMSDDICTRLRDSLGAGAVRQVVFRHAGWDEPAPRASRPLQLEAPRQGPSGSSEVPREGRDRPLSPEQKEALDALETLDLPGDLRARIARAMEAAFARGEQESVR